MSMNLVTLESDKDGSSAKPLPANRNAESWNNAEDQLNHSNLMKDNRQIDETLFIGQHIFETPNSIKTFNVSPVLPKTDFMPHEPMITLSTCLPQESPAWARATPATNGQDPYVSLPTMSRSNRLESIHESVTISTSSLVEKEPPQDPRPSFCHTSQVEPETVLQQLHGTHVQVTPTTDYHSRQTPQSDQSVRNEHHAPNMAQYFPPFRGGNDAPSAPPAMSTTAAHNYTLTAPKITLETRQVSLNTGTLAETDQGSLSRDNGEADVRLSHFNEESAPDAQILATYNLEGFRHAKIWLQNPEECSYCDEEFANEKSLQEHIKRTHRNALDNLHEPIEKVKCEHCDAFLMNETNLRRHVSNVHSQEKAKITCELCSAFFSSSFSAITHMRDIHGIQPPSRRRTNGVRKKKKVFFRCETCGYCSKEKSNVTRHVRSAHVRKKYSVQG